MFLLIECVHERTCTGYFGSNRGIKAAVSSETGLPHLPDSTKLHRRHIIFIFLLYVCVHGCCRHQIGGILSICETPEQLHGLENVAGAQIHKAVSSKRVKYQFLVNYPFNNSKRII